jgi:hypothetical protein
MSIEGNTALNWSLRRTLSPLKLIQIAILFVMSLICIVSIFVTTYFSPLLLAILFHLPVDAQPTPYHRGCQHNMIPIDWEERGTTAEAPGTEVTFSLPARQRHVLTSMLCGRHTASLTAETGGAAKFLQVSVNSLTLECCFYMWKIAQLVHYLLLSADHMTLDQLMRSLKRCALNHLVHTFLPQSVHWIFSAHFSGGQWLMSQRSPDQKLTNGYQRA